MTSKRVSLWILLLGMVLSSPLRAQTIGKRAKIPQPMPTRTDLNATNPDSLSQTPEKEEKTNAPKRKTKISISPFRPPSSQKSPSNDQSGNNPQASKEPSLKVHSSSKSDRIISVVKLKAGLNGVWRSAQVTVANSKSNITYDTGGFAPGLLLQIELHPFEILGHPEKWLRNLGTYAEANFFNLETTQLDQEIESSMARRYELGVLYRYRLDTSSFDAQLHARLGYHHTAFPIANASFPGTKYHTSALALGYTQSIPNLGFKIPMVDHLSFSALVGYNFAVFRSGKLKRLGTSMDGYALDGKFGFYAHRGNLSLGILWSMNYFSTSYQGETTLPRPVQFIDSNLSDSVHHLGLSIGYDFDIL